LLQDKSHLLIYRIAILLEVFGRRESNLKYAYVHFMICYLTVLFFITKLIFQGEIELDEDPEFDTTIVGPWMGNWDIVHHNRHTEQYKDPGDDAEKWTNYHSTWTKA